MNNQIRSHSTLQGIFERRKRSGCCLISTSSNYEVVGNDIIRAHTRFRPMSTFKVLNALIALESGATDITEEIDWDGSPTWSDTQRVRMNLQGAIRISALWFFQILARRIGLDTYRRYLDLCEYGNASCGEQVDAFWIDGTLLISPLEQLRFIERFTGKKLPFSDVVVSEVHRMLILKESAGEILCGKTGYAEAPGHHYGWFVGYRTDASKRCCFVTHIDITDSSQLGERQEITEECLTALSK